MEYWSDGVLEIGLGYGAMESWRIGVLGIGLG
jgi:hypothetical protein